MKEVYPGIFLIKEKGRFKSIKPSENVYVLAGQDGLIYDAGYGNKKAIKHLIKEICKIEKYYKDNNKEIRITRILPSHSHPDHFSGLKKIRKYLGVKILLTKITAEIIKNKETYSQTYNTDFSKDYMSKNYSFKDKIKNFIHKKISNLIYNRLYGISYVDNPDEIIDSNSTILINGELWKIFPSPGHSSDHISLYNEEKGILFSGDNILKSITTWLGPPDGNLSDYLNTIKKIQKLSNLKLILGAHGEPITNPKKRIEEILKHRNNRTQQIIEIIKINSKKGLTIEDIIKELYPDGNSIVRQMARGWIYLTLNMLEKENQIKRIDENRKIRFLTFN